MRAVLVASLGMLCCTAWAESAYTVRPTELKAKPFADAATVANLPQNSKVDILDRQSSWTQIKADKGSGWVKMLSLRIDDGGAAKKSSDSGTGALFNIAVTGNSGSNTTNGVKGFGKEELKNAHPNPKALQAMNGYMVSAADAQKFAKAGKLVEQKLDYLAAPGAGANQ